MNNNYNEEITRNNNEITELENVIRKLGRDDTDKDKYGINYNNPDQKVIIEEQVKYINHLKMLVDILYQSKEIESEREKERVLASGNVNEEFYRLYNMGRFIYNNKHYPITSMYIKVFKKDEDTLYELLSTKEQDLLILSKEVDINEYKFSRLFKFRESSMFKAMYKDKELCNVFDIDINTEEKLNKLKEYLIRFDETGYDFIKELGGETHE